MQCPLVKPLSFQVTVHLKYGNKIERTFSSRQEAMAYVTHLKENNFEIVAFNFTQLT